MRHPISICALFIASCTGSLDGEVAGGPANGSSSPSMGTAGSTGVATTPTPTPAVSAPFKVRNSEPELLSYQMRVRRIANVLGVPIDHPMFAEMNAERLRLGDYDYANGAQPDGSWNANRIATWMDALRPICASTEMKTTFPALPDNLAQLTRAAWGHIATAEDIKDYADAIAASGLDAAAVYESSCIAVFSSAELVYR